MVPAAIGVALVISTPGLLNFISPAHEFIGCAEAHAASAMTDHTNLQEELRMHITSDTSSARRSANRTSQDIL